MASKSFRVSIQTQESVQQSLLLMVNVVYFPVFPVFEFIKNR